MLDDPPEETIASITSILLGIQPQYRRRNYAGHAPGVRRKLEVCEDIAKDIAHRYLVARKIEWHGAQDHLAAVSELQ